jgi:chorismate dehydratase
LSKKIRIGFVNYLNSWPLYNRLEEQQINAEIVYGTPAQIADLMNENLLDFAQLPVVEYLRKKQNYFLYDDFCISSKNKTISSVSLYSPHKLSESWQELNGKQILLTNHSRTSVELLKILLKLKAVKGNSFASQQVNFAELRGDFLSTLIIGDDALRLESISNNKDFCACDLAEEWFKSQNTNFVFAVFVKNLRSKSAHGESEELITSIKCNLDKNLEGIQQSSEEFGELERKFGVPQKRAVEYLSGIEYRLDEERKQSIARFEELLEKISSI